VTGFRAVFFSALAAALVVEVGEGVERGKNQCPSAIPAVKMTIYRSDLIL
jgi:hypothetical protein